MDSRMEYPGYLHQGDYNALMEMAQNNPLNLIKAFPFLKEDEELYAAAALALYFGKKYKTPGKVSAKDAEYMEEYEKIILKKQDGKEYELSEYVFISLVHPIELSEASKEAWKEQLVDYEITQPIDQLNRTVYFITEEEADKKDLERFGGCVVNDLSLNGTLTKLGWYRGSVEDAGGYNTYYREDAESGMGVKLHFSGSFIGWHQEEVTIYEVSFYKAGDSACRSSGYDKEDKKKAYFLKEVPPRYFSEIILQLSKVTVSSDERDEDWKKDAGL